MVTVQRGKGIQMGEILIRRSKELKFKVTLEAIRAEKQLSQIAEEYQVHPQQVTQWKKELLEEAPELFATNAERNGKRLDAEREELLKTSGHEQVVIAWFKKKLGISELSERKTMSLVTILDWHSRKVLSWELSITADQYLVINALEEARRHYGDLAIYNTNLGAQFTCLGFVDRLRPRHHGR
jgi:transposase-like protein